MKRMKRIFEYNFGDIRGTSTVSQAQAKQIAMEMAEKALTDSYTPLLIAWKGNTAFIYRQPVSGWAYRIIWKDDQPKEGRQCHLFGYNSGFDNQDACILAVRAHLAQAGWERSDKLAIPAILAPSQANDFISWAQFQLSYKYYESLGFNPEDCHKLSGGHYWILSDHGKNRLAQLGGFEAIRWDEKLKTENNTDRSTCSGCGEPLTEPAHPVYPDCCSECIY